jgi:hypothetical protein
MQQKLCVQVLSLHKKGNWLRMQLVAIQVVEFLSGGYKIGKIFA